MQRAHGSFRDHAAVPLRDAVPRPVAYANPPTQDDWARVQGTIYEYYVQQNQPLHLVRENLRRDHGFRASERMIKARLAKWEYIKNAKREDWGYLAVLHEIRRKENKATVFLIRGHRKSVKDLQRFIRNQNISPDKFLAESFANFRDKGERIPDYIRACTPGPEDILYSPSADTLLSVTSPSDLRSPSPVTGVDSLGAPSDHIRSAPGTPSQDEGQVTYGAVDLECDHYDHKCPYKSYAAESSQAVTTERTKMASTSSSSRLSQEHLQIYSSQQTRLELEACSQQLLKPMPLMRKIGDKDMRCWMMINQLPKVAHAVDPEAMELGAECANDSEDRMDVTMQSVCSMCDQPGGRHFPSLDLFEPRHGQRNILNDASTLRVPTSTREEGSWLWVSLCFLACMSLTRGDQDVAQSVLQQAGAKFEMLIRAQDESLLTAAHLVIIILHQHNQGAIAMTVLQSAKDVVDRVLPPDNLIRLTISYLALTADSSSSAVRLKEAGFSSDRMGSIFHQFKANYRPGHPYVVAAHHNYAWLLRFEGKTADAEKHARKAWMESVECFGNLHMQTVASLSVIAGCIAACKERVEECAKAYRQVVQYATHILGIIHPYTLEIQRRLALCLYDMGRVDDAIRKHRTILFGRAAMLGRDHEFTVAQRKDYIELLKREQRWLSRDGSASPEQKELDWLNEKHPEEAWEVVSRLPREATRSVRKDDDYEMVDDFDPLPTPALDHIPDETWCAIAMKTALSRDTSPTSSNEFEAY